MDLYTGTNPDPVEPVPVEIILHSCHLLTLWFYVLPCTVLLVISCRGHNGPHPTISDPQVGAELLGH